MAEKNFKFYWDCVEVPVYVLIAWGIIGVLIQAYSSINMQYVGYFGWLVMFAVFSYIAYEMIKKKNEEVGIAAKAGAIAGAIAGFAGGIISLISYYTFPGIYSEAIQQAVSQGAPQEMVEIGIKISVYGGIVLGPIFNAIIGVIITALAAWIITKI